MGANEITNNFRAAVQYDGATQAVIAQSGDVLTVVRTGVGQYLVTLANSIAIAELSMDTALYGTVPGGVNVRPFTPAGESTQFEVFTFDVAGVLSDRQWSCSWFQLPVVN